MTPRILIHRWLRLLKLWLVVQAIPVLDPRLCRLMRHGDRHIRDASEMMRRRRGYPD